MIDWLAYLACGLGQCVSPPCYDLRYAEVKHTICSFRTEKVRVNAHLKDDAGNTHATLSRLQKKLTAPPLMLMNGGMYHEDLAPVGLYVEGGKQSARLSTKDGWGNFHLLPNGVFWGKGDRVGVTETKAFAKRKLKPDFATQSGPMLVINGKLHPRFLRNSDSVKIRNGVGVSKDDVWVHFAISQGFINFWNFGRLFRDELQTPNALFLDGSISAIRTQNFRQGGWRKLGPILSVTARK